MALTKNEQQVTWSAASSVTVSSAAVVWSDPITLDATDFAGSLQVHADNQGTPASGDVCDVHVAYTTGDILGDSGDDYDTPDHSLRVLKLDTYPTNTPGEDPACATVPIDVAGMKGLQVGVSCPQAATRNITVRARLVTQRG